jgi:hypothetical protein
MSLWQELKVKHNEPMTRRAVWVVVGVFAGMLVLFALLEHFFPRRG